jgi:hypothetical protein
MDKTSMILLPLDLDQALTDFYKAPQPNPDFTTRLEQTLAAQILGMPHSLKAQQPQKGKTFMHTLCARPILAVLLVLLALAVLTGAAYAIGRLSGFIPGFGFVQDASQVQILDTPVQTTWNDLTLEVPTAFGDPTRFWVQATLSRSPHPQALYDAQITLPDGQTRLLQQAGWSDESDGHVSLLFQFPPLPAGVTHLTLQIRYSLPGDAAWAASTFRSLCALCAPMKSSRPCPSCPMHRWVRWLAKHKTD